MRSIGAAVQVPLEEQNEQPPAMPSLYLLRSFPFVSGQNSKRFSPFWAAIAYSDDLAALLSILSTNGGWMCPLEHSGSGSTN